MLYAPEYGRGFGQRRDRPETARRLSRPSSGSSPTGVPVPPQGGSMAVPLLLAALLATALQSTSVPAPPPEWAGWFGLIALVAAFGSLGWWLLASPLPRPIAPSAPTTRLLRLRGLLA